MEFPDLGEHCSLHSCKRLDFLPVQCSNCKKTFCSSHYRFSEHDCPSARDGDRQVPICPICNKPVPLAPGESADQIVDRHITQNCPSSRDGKKVFTNRCAYRNCKRKEAMPLRCAVCHANHCLLHRHETDHECRGKSGKNDDERKNDSRIRSSNQKQHQQQQQQQPRSESSNKFLAAFERRIASINSQIRKWPAATAASPDHSEMIAQNGASAANSDNNPSSRSNNTGNIAAVIQGDLTEEEALNIAIQESLSNNHQNDAADHAQSTQTSNNNNNHNNHNNNATQQDKCQLS